MSVGRGRRVTPHESHSAPAGALAMAALALALTATGVPDPRGGTAEASELFLPSADQGPWLAADKELHFAASAAIALSWRVEGESRGTALATTLGAGVLKEVYDATLKPRRMKRGASWKDLAADLAGALAGIAVLSAIDR